MTETTIPTDGDPRQPWPAPENRRRLVIAAALLALSVALVGAYLILGGSGSTSTAGPVPHVVRSPNSAVPSAPAPTRPPAGTPSAGAVVVRNPFLPLVVPVPAGPSAAVAAGTGGSGAPATGTGAGVTGTGGTGAGTTATGSPGPGTTGSGSTGSGVNGTSGSAGAAAPAAAVDGTPNFTG